MSTGAQSGREYEQSFPFTGAPVGRAARASSRDRRDRAWNAPVILSTRTRRRGGSTGSTNVGRIIAEKAGRHLKRVLLELGGKAPMVVLADADLDRAAAAASFGAFFHQGQICMSTERIVVDRSVADSVAEKLAERARALPVGDPREPSTAIGRLLTVVPVDGPDAAVEVANDTEYGLSAAVFSENVPAALELAQRIESGICHVNDTTVHDEPQMPFGGAKASGFGRFGGRAALEEFTELRWITVQSLPRQYPI
ncbi:MAG: aldehyde dehydrogenase family protein [Solirubrobacteraceae bacterium]